MPTFDATPIGFGAPATPSRPDAASQPPAVHQPPVVDSPTVVDQPAWPPSAVAFPNLAGLEVTTPPRRFGIPDPPDPTAVREPAPTVVLALSSPAPATASAGTGTDDETTKLPVLVGFASPAGETSGAPIHFITAHGGPAEVLNNGHNGRHAAPEAVASTRPRRPVPRMVIFAGALLATVVLAALLLVPALVGGSSEPDRSQQPSPAAATPTAPSLSPTPSVSPTPSKASPSAAVGQYTKPRVYHTKAAPSPTDDEDDEDDGDYDEGDWSGDDGSGEWWRHH